MILCLLQPVAILVSHGKLNVGRAEIFQGRKCQVVTEVLHCPTPPPPPMLIMSGTSHIPMPRINNSRKEQQKNEKNETVLQSKLELIAVFPTSFYGK